MIRMFYFAAEIQESGRHLSDSKGILWREVLASAIKRQRQFGRSGQAMQLN